MSVEHSGNSDHSGLQTPTTPSATALAHGYNFRQAAGIAAQRLAAPSSAPQAAKGGQTADGGPKKKKKRGNPFRVLMGAVGKLLDHGMDKREIVRYLKKKMDYFGEDMIAKAVDIVKEYNQKDAISDPNPALHHRDPHTPSKGKIPDHAAPAPDDSSSDVEEDAFQTSNAPMVPALQGPRQFDGGMGLNIISQHDGYNYRVSRHDGYNHRLSTAEKTGNKVYDASPEWEKRSTAELSARAKWLKSLREYGPETPQGDGRKAADTVGAAGEIRSIRGALSARCFSGTELEELL